METKSLNIHITEDAHRVLDKYCGPRGRGQFISQLILDYDRKHMDGDIAIAALREKAVVSVPSQPARRKRRK